MAPERTLTDATRIVRVIPDVAGLDSEFDYLLPEKFTVQVGSKVRVPLHGRSVAAWVMQLDSTPPPNTKLLEITKVSSVGPSQDLIDLASWAAHCYASRRNYFLNVASPPRNIASVNRIVANVIPDAAAQQRSMIRDPEMKSASKQFDGIIPLAPAIDPFPLVQAAVEAGPALVLVPSLKWARQLYEKLRTLGAKVALHPDGWAQSAAGGVSVIGTMSAAWAPMPQVNSVIVLDSHDESFRHEGAPTWDAVDVVSERARRIGAPVTLVSAVPRLEQRLGREIQLVSAQERRDGWARIAVIDVREKDPRDGLYSPAALKVMRESSKVVCVLNRKGRSTRLVCNTCGETAHCEKCDGALLQTIETSMRCNRCKTDQPVICRHCGGQRFKNLRIGVSKVREELETLTKRKVGEVTSETDALPDADIIIGTEAVLHRVGRADAVVFLDFDRELLSSRIRTSEDSLILLARASRIVRGHGGGVILVQTREPENIVIQAALHADPDRLADVEAERRKLFNWPPYGAVAVLSGVNAEDYVSQAPLGVEVMQDEDGRYLLHSHDLATLTNALSEMKRPPGRLGLQVNPYRL